MTGDAFAQPEEGWAARLRRIIHETRDIVAATRKTIDESRDAMSLADERLGTRRRKRRPARRESIGRT